jgi:hypothetical protein
VMVWACWIVYEEALVTYHKAKAVVAQHKEGDAY